MGVEEPAPAEVADPPRRPSTGSPVFLAKLRPPPAAHLIRRERLIRLLDDELEARLVVVAAPAGSGKTSLVASWAAQTERPLAWYSVDDSDRDPSRLLAGILAAIDTAVPGVSAAAREVLAQRGPLDEAVAALLVDLERSGGRDAVLVIDDVHVVDDLPDVARIIGDLAAYTPEWLHLVLIGRRRPRLNIERLRAQGHLREVSFEELQFSKDETAELLRRLAPDIGDEGLAPAGSRAAGWAASIQLGGLAARVAQARGEQPGTEAGDRLTDDYLWREVLSGESPEVLDILHAASVVERLNSDLARAVSGREDAVRLLEDAADRGLFLSRLAQPGWYALHSLVRDLVHRELGDHRPELLAEMHARAARWFDDAGEAALAVRHWLAADQPREALRAIAFHNGVLYDQGRESLVVEAVASLPPAVRVSDDLDAAIDHAWANLLVDRRALVDTVDRIDGLVATTPPRGPTRGRVLVLQAVRALQRGDWSASTGPAREAAAEFGAGWTEDFLGRFVWNVLARGPALAERWDDDLPEIRRMAQTLRADPRRRLAYDATRALGLALAGRPTAALAACDEVARVADVSGRSMLSLELTLAQAVAARERGDREPARATLEVLVQRPMTPLPYVPLRALLELATCHLAAGRLDEAEARLASARSLVLEDFSGPGVSGWTDTVETLVALVAEQGDRAQGAARRITDGFWGPAAEARVALARRATDEAADHLARARPRSPRQAVVHDLLLSRVAPSSEESVEAVRRAAGRAATHGMVQTLATESLWDHRLFERLERVADSVPAPWLDRVRHFSSTPSLQPGALLVGAQALTTRERDVLRMLPSRLTVREIADELHLSTNTVKFHLKVIYRKLGCSSRSEAAAIARGMTRLRPRQP